MWAAWENTSAVLWKTERYVILNRAHVLVNKRNFQDGTRWFLGLMAKFNKCMLSFLRERHCRMCMQWLTNTKSIQYNCGGCFHYEKKKSSTVCVYWIIGQLPDFTTSKRFRGDRGSGPNPPPPGIARLLIFAMLKFSIRPLLGIWTPSPPPTPWENFLDPRMFIIKVMLNMLNVAMRLKWSLSFRSLPYC